MVGVCVYYLTRVSPAVQSPRELPKSRDTYDFGDAAFSLLSHRSYCELGTVLLAKENHMSKSRFEVDEGRNSKVTLHTFHLDFTDLSNI